MQRGAPPPIKVFSLADVKPHGPADAALAGAQLYASGLATITRWAGSPKNRSAINESQAAEPPF
jgi:hypothetical protein